MFSVRGLRGQKCVPLDETLWMEFGAAGQCSGCSLCLGGFRDAEDSGGNQVSIPCRAEGLTPWPLIKPKMGNSLRVGSLVTSECPPLPHRTGCMELVSMEDQDARVPALEPYRVEQVVRTGGAEGEGGD